MWKSPRLLIVSGSSAAVLLVTALACTAPNDNSDTTERPSFATATSPVPVLVGAGDIADCDSNNGETLTANVINSMPGATVFADGDIAYLHSTATELANCYNPSWGQFKDRTKPVLGNHEYDVSPTPAFDYFGSSAWANSAPNGYYSFDLGSWHIVVLNDNNNFVSSAPKSAQITWLKADLAATSKPCILALWHQPLFFSAPTGSAAPGLSSWRKNLWAPLYAAGADVVVNGHHHMYERFGLQDPNGAATSSGIRQFIVGTGGSSTIATPTVLSPNSQVRHGGSNQFGVLKLTLYDGSYSWEYIPVGTNTFTDRGSTSCHGVTPPGGASAVSVQAGNGQSAPAATAVAVPPSVKVTDGSNNPVAGVPVQFNVTAGGGSVTEDLQTTDASGIAQVGSWTLGPSIGTNQLEAVVSGLESAVFTATATAGGVSAAASTATVPGGIATVATTIKVQARDGSGSPITTGGATVAVSISGANTAAPAVTDNGNGTYTAQYIPKALGTDQVAITLNGTPLGSSPYSSVVVAKIKGYSGTNQTAPAGSTLPVAPAIRATDGLGHGIAGLTITFSVLSGGGSVTGAVQTTNSTGVARVGSWTLGPVIGTQRLRATLNGTASTATINATAQ